MFQLEVSSRLVRDWWMIRNRKEEEERPRRIISHLNQIYKTFIMQQQIIQQQFGSQLTQQLHNFTKRPLNERKTFWSFFKLNFGWNNRISPFLNVQNDLIKNPWIFRNAFDLEWPGLLTHRNIYRLKRTGGVW